jgi:CelD/BcsL family acetyltransferase involved in cellulose biosynthesis
MAKLGAAEIREYRTGEDGETLRVLFEVAGRAWKSEEGLGITNRPASKAFFGALTERAGRLGWLRLWVLRLNDVPVAIEYHVQEDGVAYALRAEFDQEHRKHSPGAYLEYHILHRLFEEGARAYYTGPGLDAYKRRWTEDLRRNVAITVYQRGLRNRLRWAAEGWALPRLRRLRDRLRRSGAASGGDPA